jgi:EAL and modified HD-GYP domain-containing signal transduction protein
MGVEGEYVQYLDTVRAFESGLWGKIITQSEKMNVSQKDLHALFNDAIRWSNEMRQALSDFFPRAKPRA